MGSLTALQPPASAMTPSRKPKRTGRSGRDSEQAVAVPGIGFAKADQVGDGGGDVEQGDDLAVPSGRQPRMRADDQERGPHQLAIEAVGAGEAAMLAQIVAVVAVDRRPEYGRTRAPARSDSISSRSTSSV